MKRTILPALLALLPGWGTLGLPLPARADDTLVPLAVVNGLPVYRSELFKSQKIKDEVDRALILQAYQKSDNVLPPGLVATALQNIVKENYGNDANRLVADLQRYKATPEDYVRYLTEELVLTAMLDEHKDDAKGQWLDELRKAATIERVKPGDKLPPAFATAPKVAVTPTPEATPAPRAADPRRKPDPEPPPKP